VAAVMVTGAAALVVVARAVRPAAASADIKSFNKYEQLPQVFPAGVFLFHYQGLMRKVRTI